MERTWRSLVWGILLRLSGGLAAVLLLFFAGSTMTLGHEVQSEASRPTRSLPADLADYYRPAEEVETAILRQDQVGSLHRQWGEFVFDCPVNQAPRRVSWEYYEGRADRMPILVIPILAGHYSIARPVCRYLSSQGHPTLLIHREEEIVLPEFDGREIEEILRRSIHNLRLGVRHLAGAENRPVAAIGISMGGILGSMLAAVEPRVERMVTVMAGGDLPEIVVESWEGSIVRYREGRDLPDRALEQDLRKHVRTDPIRLAAYAEPDRFLCFITRFDRHVPTDNQRELWRKLGRPRAVSIPSGHYVAALFFDQIMNRTLSFIRNG